MADPKIIIHYHHAFSKHANRFKSKKKSIEGAIGLFQRDIFNHRLKTHKLEGELKNYWSFSVDYHLRILFKFIDIYQDVMGKVDIFEPLQKRPWGLRDFRVVDLFGFYLRFTTPHNIFDPKYAVK